VREGGTFNSWIIEWRREYSYAGGAPVSFWEKQETQNGFYCFRAVDKTRSLEEAIEELTRIREAGSIPPHVQLRLRNVYSKEVIPEELFV